MIKIKEIDIQEYRDKILLFIASVLLLFLGYFLYYRPFTNLSLKRAEVEEYFAKKTKEEKRLEAGRKRYSRLEEELKKERESLERSKEKLKEGSFLNLVELERYISDVTQSNQLTIETIGRVERIEETDKVYIPYVIFGNLENILNFIDEIEKNEKGISLSETHMKLEIEKNSVRLSCKISTNVLERIEEGSIVDRNIFPYRDFVTTKIKEIKFLKYGDKNYIIIRYVDGSKELLYEGKRIERFGKNYEIILQNKGIYLKLLDR